MKILCLDFDGVIHSYSSGWKGPRCIPDPPVPGAIKFLLDAQEMFSVTIYSSRSSYWFGRRSMKRWLRHQFIEYFWNEGKLDLIPADAWTGADIEEEARIWANEKLRKIDFPTSKPAAFVTVDDRAVTFTGVFPNLNDLASFTPWNKGKK